MTGRLWAAVRSNPVRVWAYGVLVPACGVLVVYGLLTTAQAAAWIGLGAGVCGIPIGAEVVRARVTPWPPSPPTEDAGTLCDDCGQPVANHPPDWPPAAPSVTGTLAPGQDSPRSDH